MSEFTNIIWHGIPVQIHWSRDYNIIKRPGLLHLPP